MIGHLGDVDFEHFDNLIEILQISITLYNKIEENFKKIDFLS